MGSEMWIRDRAARDAAAVNDADLEAVVAVAEGRDAPAADSFLNSFGLWWIGANAPSLTLVHLLRLEKRNPRHSVQWTLRSRAAGSYTHLRAHQTVLHLLCRLLLEKKKTNLHYATCLFH